MINNSEAIDIFAIILDVNGYSKMVSSHDANLIAQFTRDTLYGGIKAVEKNGGEVVGFMGDAFFAILKDSESVFKCCVSIAKDIDRQCEYISCNSQAFPFAPKGPSIKIGIEYGHLDISEISSRFLGVQKIFAGEAINYASRIMQAESGNRCLFGPKAYEMGLNEYLSKDEKHYYEIHGKNGEGKYKYYKLNLGDIWIEGDSDESFWG